LAEDLGDLAGGKIALEGPVLFSAGIGADLCRSARFVAKAISECKRDFCRVF
jgi:hypothetical protein